jgi:hypothetical protein
MSSSSGLESKEVIKARALERLAARKARETQQAVPSSVTPRDESAYPYTPPPPTPAPTPLPTPPSTPPRQQQGSGLEDKEVIKARALERLAARKAAQGLGPTLAAPQPPITAQRTLHTSPPAARGNDIRLLVDGVSPSRLQFTVAMILQKQSQRYAVGATPDSSSTGAAAVMGGGSSSEVHPAYPSHNDPAGEVQDMYRDPAFRALLHQFVKKEEGDFDEVDSLACGLLGMLNGENADRQTQARVALLLIVETMITVQGNESILLKMKDLLSSSD